MATRLWQAMYPETWRKVLGEPEPVVIVTIRRFIVVALCTAVVVIVVPRATTEATRR